MTTATKWILVILVGAGIGLALAYVWYRTSVTSIDDFYAIRESYVDTSKVNAAAGVWFVRVATYDSTKILRTAEHLTREAVESNLLPVQKRRIYLFQFFVETDTATLTKDMINELAYTNPSILASVDKLQVIAGGWVVRADFAANVLQPQKIDIQPSRFYMPRPGVRAQDFR